MKGSVKNIFQNQRPVVLNHRSRLPVISNGCSQRPVILSDSEESNNHHSIQIRTKARKERHSERSEETKTTGQTIAHEILRFTQDDRRWSNKDDSRPIRRNKSKQGNHLLSHQSQLSVMLNGSSQRPVMLNHNGQFPVILNECEESHNHHSIRISPKSGKECHSEWNGLSRTSFWKASESHPGIPISTKVSKWRHSERSEESDRPGRNKVIEILRFTQDDSRPCRRNRIKQVNHLLSHQNQRPVTLGSSQRPVMRNHNGQFPVILNECEESNNHHSTKISTKVSVSCHSERSSLSRTCIGKASTLQYLNHQLAVILSKLVCFVPLLEKHLKYGITKKSNFLRWFPILVLVIFILQNNVLAQINTCGAPEVEVIVNYDFAYRPNINPPSGFPVPSSQCPSPFYTIKYSVRSDTDLTLREASFLQNFPTSETSFEQSFFYPTQIDDFDLFIFSEVDVFFSCYNLGYDFNSIVGDPIVSSTPPDPMNNISLETCESINTLYVLYDNSPGVGGATLFSTIEVRIPAPMSTPTLNGTNGTGSNSGNFCGSINLSTTSCSNYNQYIWEINNNASAGPQDAGWIVLGTTSSPNFTLTTTRVIQIFNSTAFDRTRAIRVRPSSCSTIGASNSVQFTLFPDPPRLTGISDGGTISSTGSSTCPDSNDGSISFPSIISDDNSFIYSIIPLRVETGTSPCQNSNERVRFGGTNYCRRPGAFNVTRSNRNAFTLQGSATRPLLPGFYEVTLESSRNNSEVSSACATSYLAEIEPPSTLNFTSATPSPTTCSGGNDGSITVLFSNAVGQVEYRLNDGEWEVLPNNDTITDLVAGNYEVLLRDACETIVGPITLTVNDGPPLTAQVDATAPSCLDNGSIEVTADDVGAGSYDFQLSGAGSGNSSGTSRTATFNNLAPGNYTVEITSPQNCKDTLSAMVPEVPGSFSIGFQGGSAPTGPLCPGATQPVTVEVTQADGVDHDYTYELINDSTGWVVQTIYSSTNTTGVLNASGNINYTIRVTDNCRNIANVRTLDFFLPLHSDNLSIGNITFTPPEQQPNHGGTIYHFVCKDDDVALDVEVSGGSGSYTLDFGGVAPTSSSGSRFLFEGISQVEESRDYVLTLTDATCTGFSEATETITLNEVAKALALSTTPSVVSGTTFNVTCHPGNGGSTGDGVITASATGGLTPYTYFLDGVQGGPIFSGLTIGTYNVSVEDELGCRVTEEVTLTSAPEITATLTTSFSDTVGATTYHFQCKDDDVTLTVDTEGGVYPHAVELFRTADNMRLDSVSISEVVDAAFVINQTEASVEYEVRVTDALGCSLSPASLIVLNEAPEAFAFEGSDVEVRDLSASSLGFNVTCADAEDGEIVVRPRGGVPPFTYEIFSSRVISITNYRVEDKPEREHVFNQNIRATMPGLNDLTPVVYDIRVTDALGCTFLVEDFVLTEPEPLAVTPPVLPDENGFELACAGDVLDVQFQVSGGIVPDINGYLITLQNSEGTYNTNAFTVINPTTVKFRDLPFGTYQLTLRDELDQSSCQIVDSVFFTLTEPPVLNIMEDSVAPPLCLQESSGYIEVSAAGGVPLDNPSMEYDFEIVRDGSNFHLDAFSTDPVSRNGATAVFNVPSGEYDIQVTDRNNCTDMITVVVPDRPDPLTLSVETVQRATCFGAANGSITVSASGGDRIPAQGYRFELFSGPLADTLVLFSNAGDAVTFAGLEASNNPGGTLLPNYRVNVFDANECSVIASNSEEVEVTSPTQLNLLVDEARSIHPTCFNFDDGQLTVYVEGGEAPYQFSLDGTNFYGSGAAATFDSLDLRVNGDSLLLTNLFGNKTYEVFVRDVNFDPGQPACTRNLEVFLPHGPRIDIVPSVVDNQCFGDSNGGITIFTAFTGHEDASLNIDSNGEPGSFRYQWRIPGDPQVIATTKDLVDLPSGTYQLRASREGFPCFATASITVNQPSEPLEITAIDVFDESCTNKADGFAVVEVDGGRASARSRLQYEVNGGPFNALQGSVIDGLSAGNYDLTVQNALGCEATGSFSVAIGSIDLRVWEIEEVSCFGGSNGVVTLEAQPSLPGRSLAGLEYSLDGVSFQVSPVFPGLTAGTYSFFVREQANPTCAGILEDVVVGEPGNAESPEDCNPLRAFVLSVEPTTCSAASDGVVDIEVQGGTGPFVFSWSHDGLLNAATAENLAEGNYEVIVEDGLGARDTVEATVNSLPVLEIIAINTEDIGCYGACTGRAQVVVAGGSGDYVINWSDGQVGVEASELCSGTYSVVVSEARNSSCTVSASLSIEEQEEIVVITEESILPTCSGDNDGRLTLEVTGGGGVFDVVWPDGQTGVTAVNLASGSYEVEITDVVFGCEINYLAELEETPSLMVSDAALIEPSCFGESNGMIRLTIDNARNPFITWSNGAQGSEIQGLSAGSYTVTILDADGCSLNTTYTLGEPEALVIDAIETEEPSCFGFGDGVLEAIVSGGTAPYRYTWSLNGTTLVVGSQEAKLDGVRSGSYRLEVRDANFCGAERTGEVGEPEALTLINVIEQEPSCQGLTDGSIAVEVDGGTPEYSFSWDTGIEGPELTDVGRGSYTVTINDANDCLLTEAIELDEPEAVQITGFTLTEPSCNGAEDGSIAITVSGGDGNYTIAWSNGQTGTVAENLTAGSYSVEVSDGNSCSVSRNFNLGQPDGLSIFNVTLTDPTCFKGSDGAIDLTVAGGNGGFTFDWSNGADTLNIDNLGAGTYTLTVTDSLGCTRTESYTLEDPEELFITTIAEEIVLCQGSSVVLDAGAQWATYTWSREGEGIATSRELTVSQPGRYALEVTSVLGCEVNTTFEVEVGDNIVDSDFVFDSEIDFRDTVVVIEVTLPQPDRVEWSLPEGVFGLSDRNAFTQEFLFDAPGDYVIGLYSYIDNCVDYIEKTITVSELLVEANGSENGRTTVTNQEPVVINVFPNPTDGEFTVTINTEDEGEIRVGLYDFAYGQVIEERVLEGSRRYAERFERTYLENGIYFLQVKKNGETYTQRIVIAR